jgi:NADH-quinone oxidoreductase subunit K
MVFFEILKYFLISIFLFFVGFFGIFLAKKSIIIILMSIELLLLAVNLNFIIFSIYLNDLVGQTFSFFTLTIAAAESAIGLAVLVVYYSIKGIILINFVNCIKR